MRNKIFLGLILFLFLNNNLFAQQEAIQEEKPRPSLGLSVQPGGMLIQYVKLGETFDLYEKSGIPLIIENKDTKPHTYKLTTSKPSQVGNRKWLKGYLEIPDPGWFWFEEDEVTVEPQSKKAVKMFLKFPNEEKYYNQHWTVSLGVAGKPEPGQMLTLAVYPRYQIETESKTGLKEKPDGLIGIEPGTLLFENLALGEAKKIKVKLYNNNTKWHKYKIKAMIFPVDLTRELITTSPTYSWIPNPKWVKPGRRRVSIAANESKELFIKIKIPDEKENYNKKWEAIIFVEPKKGLPGFVRVQIQTEKAEKNEE